MEFDLDLSRPQGQFYVSEAKYTAAVAGFGSGKTQVALDRMLKNMIESPGLAQAYICPTYGLIRDIWYPKVETTLDDMKIKYEINYSNHEIKIKGLGNIICRTMEKPGSIVGWEVGDIFLDELDILSYDKALHVFRKASARMRQKNPTGRKNQLFVTTTPEGFKATYDLFRKNPLKDSQLIQMSTYSNQVNLPEDYIQGLLDQYPEQLIRAYLLGEFVNLTDGAVYYAFDRDRCNTDIEVEGNEPVYIGMDFNVYNMAAIVHVMRNGKAYAVDELVGLRDTPDMIEAIENKYYNNAVTVFPDASGENKSSKGASLSDINLLRKANFKIKADRTNPRVKVRIQEVNRALESGKYWVNVRKCPDYTSALEQQVYKASGDPDKSSGLDHPVDAGGYFVHQTFPMEQRHAFTQLRMI